MVVRHHDLAHRRAQERQLRALDEAHLVLGARPGHALADQDERVAIIGYSGKNGIRDCAGIRGSGRLRGRNASIRAAARTALETHPRHEPTKRSRTRIKRSRGLRRPQCRLRISEVRVVNDIYDSRVDIWRRGVRIEMASDGSCPAGKRKAVIVIQLQ